MSINQNSSERVTLVTDTVMVIRPVSEIILSNQVLINFVNEILICSSQNVAGHGILMGVQM